MTTAFTGAADTAFKTAAFDFAARSTACCCGTAPTNAEAANSRCGVATDGPRSDAAVEDDAAEEVAAIEFLAPLFRLAAL